MLKLTDDGYCFVCGPKNPQGLKLKFSFDGKTMSTRYIPKKEHQGYKDIVHGGIIATILDEIMVKLAIAMDMPSVTAQMDIRLRKAVKVGEEIIFTAEISTITRKTLDASAKAVTTDNVFVADAKGKLVRIEVE